MKRQASEKSKNFRTLQTSPRIGVKDIFPINEKGDKNSKTREKSTCWFRCSLCSVAGKLIGRTYGARPN